MRKSILFIAIISSFFNACHLRARAKVADRITFHDDLNYFSADKDTGFDLYTPKNATAPTPVAIFIHGGYWRNQTRSYYQAFTGLYQNFGLALASRGIATAVIDYRLYPRAQLKDQLDDVAAAISSVKANAAKYNIDPTRIFLVGHSAGGHLALLTLWQRRNADVRAVVALSPILDVAHMRQNKEADFNRELTVPFFGSGADDAQYTPATYAVKNSGNALILFGEKDYSYLIEQGKTYKDKFTAAGYNQIRFAAVPATDHSEMVLDVHTERDKVSDAVKAYILELSK